MYRCIKINDEKKTMRPHSPALSLGLTLYILKREHWSNPIVYIPFLLIVPTILFYIALAIAYGDWSTSSLAEARAAGWFFPLYKQTKFWDLWMELYGGLTPNEPLEKRVVLSAITPALGDVMICVLMASIDMLGKQVGTKNLLQMQSLSLERETILAGLYNLPLALIGGAPSYTQLKVCVCVCVCVGYAEDFEEVNENLPVVFFFPLLFSALLFSALLFSSSSSMC